MTSGKQHRVLGSRRDRRGEYPCGLCGVVGRLTKTHVPPQCAGNSSTVGRKYLVESGGRITGSGREVRGGLYMFGLCDKCNGLQSRYDDAYGALATALLPYSRTTNGYDPNHRTKLPETIFRPGAVARSMFIGAHGLTPQFRNLHPDVGVDLRAETASVTPDGLHLLIAISRGTSARIAGATHGFFAVGPLSARALKRPEPVGLDLLAEVYFPPLAWVITDDPELLLLAGWQDVTSWLAYSPGDEHLLSALVPELPQVSHPRHTPLLHDWYVEMFADEDAGITEIVESRKLAR
ncbi:hypothetical protein ACFYTF_28820 [Nocardia thailandica]|uniref:HNH endonuclease n=1 Tax=Nocardia thailandica TaxID=257275 RepID=A0ABW6PWN3_9NOCA